MMSDLGLGILVALKDGFTANAARVETSMQSLDATVAGAQARMSRNMDLIQHGAMVTGAGLALMAAPAGLVASTIQTQSALAGLASMGVRDFATLEAAAERFTNQWAGASKAEFLDTTYEVKGALAQLSDAAVGEFTAAAALTASATKASVAEMVSAFTTGYGIYKPLAADMTDIAWARMFSGAMAQTVAAFKTNGAQMADAIKNIGAMAASAQVPLEEQLAILGQLQTTMPGAEAGTLYKAFIQKVGVGAKELGLTFTDAQGHMLGIVPIIQTLKQRFPDLASVAAQMELQKAFGTDEAVKFILQMSAGLDTLEGNITSVRQAMQGGTAVTEGMARAMTSDVGSGLKLVSQQTRNLVETLGGTLLPLTTPTLQSVQFVVLRLQDWARVHPRLTRAILTTVLGVGALLTVVGAGMAVLGSLGLLLPAVQAGMAALAPILAGVGAAFVETLLPVALLVTGAIAAVWLLRQAWATDFGGLRTTLMAWWEHAVAVFTGIGQLISTFDGQTGSMSADVAAHLERAGLLNFVITVFQVYARVRAFLEGLWAGFSSFFGNIRAAVEPAVGALVGAFGGLLAALGRLLGIVSDTKVAVAGTTGSWRQFGQAVGEVLGFVGQVVATVFAGVIYVITGVVQVIRGVVVALTWVRDGMAAIAAPIIAHWSTIATVTKYAAVVLGTIFGPALIQTGIQATVAGAQIIGSFVRGLTMAASINLVRTLNQLRMLATMSWSNVVGGVQGVVGALRAAGVATVQYALAGWRAVGALAAQGAQWVVLRVQTLAGVAGLVAARIAQVASSVATGIATAVTWAYNAALLANPITWIVLAIIGLIAVVVLLWKNWATVTGWLTSAWQAIRGAAVAVFDWLAGFFRQWGLTILAVILGPIGLIWLAIYRNWDRIRGWLAGAWEAIRGVAVGVFTGLMGFFRKWGVTILAVLTGPVGLIALAVYKHWDRIKGFLTGAWGWMKKAGGAIWDGVRTGASAIGGWCTKAWDGIRDGAGRMWQGIQSAGTAYTNVHRGNLDMVKSIATGAWDAIANGHGSLWDRCKAASGAAVEAISAKYPVLGSAMQAVGTTINGVWASITGAASSAWTAISTGASAAWQSVTNVLGTLQTSISQAWEAMKQAALDAGGKLMEALAEGIRNAAMAPVNAVKAGLDKVCALLPHSDADTGPLSTLTASGFATLDTFARGIARAQALPAQAMGQAFAFEEHLPSLMLPRQHLLLSWGNPDASGPAPMAAAVAPGAPVPRAFAPVAVMPAGGTSVAPTAAEPLRDLLALIADKLDVLARQQPGETVVTLDGREIARAVSREVREQRIRSYQSWS